MAYYRVTVGGLGIYEAVDRDCPKGDLRRGSKPDGSWLPKVGMKYPGAISYWTESGYQRYVESGLAAWHASVVKGRVEASLREELGGEVLYEDELQVIVR